MSTGSLGKYRLPQNFSLSTFTKNLIIWYAAHLLLKYVLYHAVRDLPQRCLNRALLETERERNALDNSNRHNMDRTEINQKNHRYDCAI